MIATRLPPSYLRLDKPQREAIDNLTRYINLVQNLIPIGVIFPFSGQPDAVAHPFFVANGQAVSRRDYKPYFDLVGESFGEGDGETTFNVPDATGKFFMGTPNTDTNNRAGQTVEIDYVEASPDAVLTVLYVTPIIRGA